MSMISAQIDELRERAKVLRQGRWSDGADDARLMEDAADTIWQLRDDLQRTNAENAKMREDLEFERSENGWAREFLNRMGQKCGTKDCPSLVSYVTKMEVDNAKLRKLVASFIELSQDMVIYAGQNMERHFDKRLRKLGVPL